MGDAHVALLTVFRVNLRAESDIPQKGSGPVNNSEEPFLASRSAVSLPSTPT